jgi:transposase
MLSPEAQSKILAWFYSEKRSIRSIAEELGITRDSVRRVVKRRQVHLQVQIGKKPSILDPYKDQIAELLKRDPRIGAAAVLNQIREMGYMGGITILHDYLKTKRENPARAREAFLRLEFAPGEAAQVDWGEFGDVFGDGIKIHCFAMVLCYSRYIYIEFTRSEKFEDFIRSHENAFRFYGGAPKECWYDNLRTAVSDRMGSLVRFNARFMAYMGHHGIRPHACNPARGNEKGRVEDLIKYIRSNFWAGRKFESFEDLTKQAILWRNQTANQRQHRSTHRIVRLQFESEEKKALLPLNPHPYDTDEVISRVVPPDFHILYETNRYSVPWTLVGLTVTIRIHSQTLKIYYNERLVAAHVRQYRKNRVITLDSHKTGLLERKPGGSKESWQLSAVKRIGPQMNEYIELLRSGHRSLRVELAKILALATVYGDQAVHLACRELLSLSMIGVEHLELTLKKKYHPSQKRPELMNFQNQKLNRIVPVPDLRRYDALLFESKGQISASEKEDHGNTNESGSNPEQSRSEDDHNEGEF